MASLFQLSNARGWVISTSYMPRVRTVFVSNNWLTVASRSGHCVGLKDEDVVEVVRLLNGAVSYV